MTIDFVPKGARPIARVTPSIKFNSGYDGFQDATIYIDDIPVAYFSSAHGGIVSIGLETGPFIGDDDTKEVAHLKERGFVFVEKEIEGRGPGFIEHYITLEGPR
jgi:hypothetical protein